jgi:hypothetical protein
MYMNREESQTEGLEDQAAGFGEYPAQARMGRRGYFGKAGSDWESWQRRN